jgi:hypothetical protein
MWVCVTHSGLYKLNRECNPLGTSPGGDMGVYGSLRELLLQRKERTNKKAAGV